MPMINYSTWRRRLFSVTSLKLDERNPRLPETPEGKSLTQPKIIEHLVETEGAYELAKKIAIQGYFPNEEPIICKEGSKYVVLEGNRRVCACKILLNPDLLKSKAKRNNIVKLLKEFDIDLIKKLYVREAPNREAADVIIVNRHTEGAEIEKWDKTRQDKFFHLRFSDGESIENLSTKFGIPKGAIKDGLRRYHVYVEMCQLELADKIRKNLENESKFSMTNVERFYKSKEGQDFLPMDFDDKGQIIHKLPKTEFQKRLTRITKDATENKINSRTLGTESDRQKYLDKVKNESQFDFTVIPSTKYQKEYTAAATPTPEAVPITTTTKKTTVRKSAAANRLIPDSINWVSGIARIDRIFLQIKKANLTTQIDTAAILFRSYLDMVVYQYLHKSKEIDELLKEKQQQMDIENASRVVRVSNYIQTLGIVESDIVESELKEALKSRIKVSRDWVPSLRNMLVYLSKSQQLLPDAKLRQALQSYLRGNGGFLGHNEFNLFVHNEYFVKDIAELKNAFEQMEPILAHIIDNLNVK